MGSALVFLELSEEALDVPLDDAVALSRRFATAATADATAAQLTTDLAALRGVLGPVVSVEVAPISWMVAGVEDGGAEYVVSVWYVEVLTVASTGVVSAAFRTYSAQVLWEGDRWRLGEAEVFDGPTPPVPAAATDTAALRAMLDGFGDGDRLAPFVVGVGG